MESAINRHVNAICHERIVHFDIVFSIDQLLIDTQLLHLLQGSAGVALALRYTIAHCSTNL
jgi:hypothetical protein